MNPFDLPTTHPELYRWVLLPALIFCARILDQSIGTLRLIYVSRSMRGLAAVLGFFEVTIWILAASQVFQHLDSWATILAYGAGFAAGNFIGITIEEKLSLGHVIIRVIPVDETAVLVEQLRAEGHGVTVLDAQGISGPRHILFMVVRRQDIGHVIDVVKQHAPTAFFSVEDTKIVREGTFRPRRSLSLQLLRFLGKKSK